MKLWSNIVNIVLNRNKFMGVCCAKGDCELESDEGKEKKTIVDLTLSTNKIVLICDESELNGSRPSHLTLAKSASRPSDITGSYKSGLIRESALEEKPPEFKLI